MSVLPEDTFIRPRSDAGKPHLRPAKLVQRKLAPQDSMQARDASREQLELSGCAVCGCRAMQEPRAAVEVRVATKRGNSPPMIHEVHASLHEAVHYKVTMPRSSREGVPF